MKQPTLRRANPALALVKPTLLLLSATALAAGSLGCEQRTPTAPASRPGEAPSWGKDFGTQQPRSPDAPRPMGDTGGSLADRGLPSPGGGMGGMPQDAQHRGQNPPMGPTGMDWSGGDVQLGEQVFAQSCARCHGAKGGGGNSPDVGPAPDLTNPELHVRLSDGQLASVIAHGKGRMPMFANQLDGARLKGLVAYVRSLNRKK